MGEQPHGETEASAQIRRGLAIAVALSVAVLAFEAVGAILSRSLAVTVDAVHDLPDIFAFSVSYLSLLWIARGGTQEHTFGSHRFEVFAALLNAFVILTAGVLFAYPAILSLVNGVPTFGRVDPAWIFLAAAPTLVLRTVSAIQLGRIPRAARDLNVRSVLVHLGCDVAITAALVADAAVLALASGTVRVDAAAALVVAAILVYESIPIFRGGWEVLTEGVPSGVSLADVAATIRGVPRVREVHDLHVWAVCPTFVCMTAHVEIDEMSVSDSAAISEELRRRVEEQFGIVHSVFECEPPSPEVRPASEPA